MWSDASGRQKRNKENSKLLSSRWHWVSGESYNSILQTHATTNPGFLNISFRYPIGLSISKHPVVWIEMDGNMLLIFQQRITQKNNSPTTFEGDDGNTLEYYIHCNRLQQTHLNTHTNDTIISICNCQVSKVSADNKWSVA